MKNFTPTLVFLFFLCLYNFSSAQEKFGFNIQNTLQESNHLNSSSDENERLNRLLPITYTYDDGWISDNPIGIATSIDTIIIESGTVNISANTVCDNLVVNPGAAVTVDTGVTLTTAVVDLNSTSQMFSSLIADGTIIGAVNYHRYASKIGTNDLISSPVSNQLFEAFALVNIGDLAASGLIRAFAPYNTTAGAYQNYDIINNATTVIESGVGYRVATVDGSTLTFSGLVRTDDVLDIPISDAASGDAWNLIGNPYPSYLEFDTFFNLNKSQFDGASHRAIYGYDGDASDGWTVWNQATIDSPAITELIAPGQAFFVKAKPGGGLIDFTTSMRCSGTSDDFILGRTTLSAHHGHIKLNMSSGSSSYSTDFYFNSNASDGFDPGYDAALYGEPSSFSIYSHLVENNTGTAFAIQSLNPDAMYDIAVPLGINATQGQEITISITETDMPNTIDIYLEDTVANTLTLLNTNDFVFTPSTDLSGTGRFFLRFESDVLHVAQSTLEILSIYNNTQDRTIVISGELQQGTTGKLYNMSGQLVLSNALNSATTQNNINVSALSTGIYMLELSNSANDIRIHKLIIQ
ncbi:T9SS type A sorting domain-containing protein [Psychroserpens algicola]|uniref:T9SS type A sorting domain-containing protein n=1 Tax=Psychroserpens algicola TaxID=1719034 RepID=A0ABT0HBX6_9FLAO|nr:T9SS type A sorting domain-containing protein [Psychroserpens algicola]MCK8481874.1 T9SS type A sorting domain-containing protein [Psychroserpens algicola]